MYKEPFSDMRWRFNQEAAWRPPTDVYETEEAAVVMVEIAGLQEGDFNISLSGRTLIITGERRDPSEKRAYQQLEIRYGKFRTQAYLPWAVDSRNIEATYDRGLLKVVLPKAQARRIPVEVVEPEAAQATGEEDRQEG